MSTSSENLKGFYSAMEEILSFLGDLKDKLNKAEVDKMVGMLVEAWGWGKIILIVGAGRSGLIGRAFAMRLMHLGFRTYVVGETITPAIGPNDVLIAISGSGSTAIVVTAAEAAKKVG
ncbi:MAG: SIS domain-containing protein, partial [Candidatus Nezhaarchaeales archaeon]